LLIVTGALGVQLFHLNLVWGIVAIYTGPVAVHIDGADLSWLVGLIVTTPLYYWLANRDTAYRRRQNVAGQMSSNI
jgi:purine-cytosine permease-like protein